MVIGLKCLLWKQEDLSSNPWHPHNTGHDCAPAIDVLENGDRWVPETCWPASLDETKFSERSVSLNKMERVGRGGQPMSSSLHGYLYLHNTRPNVPPLTRNK